jgi:hypothetical protein
MQPAVPCGGENDACAYRVFIPLRVLSGYGWKISEGRQSVLRAAVRNATIRRCSACHTIYRTEGENEEEIMKDDVISDGEGSLFQSSAFGSLTERGGSAVKPRSSSHWSRSRLFLVFTVLFYSFGIAALFSPLHKLLCRARFSRSGSGELQLKSVL